MRASKSGVALSNVCFILVSVSRVAFGQASGAAQTPAPSAPAAAQAPAPSAQAVATGPRAEAARLIEDAETKLTKLAQAIPADKYSWRPGKDVRSVSEWFMPVPPAISPTPPRIGPVPPAGFNPQGFDKSTADKSKVMDEMKRSFAHAKQAVAKLTDADMEKTADWIGG